MKATQFTNLIQIATGRDFQIATEDSELINEKDYFVYRILPVTGKKILFKWTTPKAEEKYLRSFITAFTTKYREPNPGAYTTCSPYFSPAWSEMTAEKQEFAYSHHASNMYSKTQLMDQVEANFNNPDITTGLNRYGFYATEYGIGTFILFATKYVEQSIKEMAEYLRSQSISFSNEYSTAGWVLRFKINASKSIHEGILTAFSNPAPQEELKVIAGVIPEGYTKSETPACIPQGYLTREQTKAYNTPAMIAERKTLAEKARQLNVITTINY